MIQKRGQVGFSQRVKLEWLELAASHAMAGSNEGETCDALRELLRNEVSVGSDAERGNREKIITIVKRIWLSNEDSFQGLRQRGIGLLRRLPKEMHIVVH